MNELDNIPLDKDSFAYQDLIGQSPLIKKGDVLGKGVKKVSRVPVGSDTQVLTADSTQATGIKWATITSATVNVKVLAMSAVAVTTPADTNEDTLVTIVVPANTLGLNGALRIHVIYSTIISAPDNYHLRIRFSGAAGTVYANYANVSGILSGYGTHYIVNRNATNSQVGESTDELPYSSNAIVTSAVDTTAQTTIVITGQKTNAGDTLKLESYVVEVLTP